MRRHHRRFGLVLLASVPAAALAAQQPQPCWTPEQTMQTLRVGSAVVSPDGRWAAVEVTHPVMEAERSEWRTTLHLLALEGTGPGRVVRQEESARSPAWSPDGRWLAFVSDRSGRSNLWRLAPAGGAAEQLTDLPASPGEYRWSPDGRTIAFVMRDPAAAAEREAVREKRDARVVGEGHHFARLYLVSVEPAATAAPRLLTPASIQVGGHVGAGAGGPAFDWAPDGSTIAFVHSPSPLADDWVNADVSVVDVATGSVRPLAATAAAEGGVAWSPDGRWLAVSVHDSPSHYALTSRVHLLSPETGAVRPLADSYDQRAAIVGWSGDSREVIITEGRGTGTRLSALPAAGGAPRDLSPDTLLVAGPVMNPAGDVVGFVSEAADRPPEAYLSSLAPFRPRQVTAFQAQPELPLGRTEVVSWTSFDGKSIEGLLTYPVGYRPGASAPLLVIVHGGPPSNFTNTFIARGATYPIAVLACAGFAVLRPNVRGSAGYGREFRYANVRDWGGGDYRDLMAGVDALVERGIADSARLGIMGWSYGGYLTAFTITQTTRFRAASVGAGITDLVSFAGTADIPGFVASYFGSEFWQEPALWQARSAVYNAARVTTPTLIQHGEADERVPVSQGYQLYHALRRRDVPVSMVVYPRQGHGISEPKLQLDAMRRNVEWFRRWLFAGGN